jgi:methionine aminopeptidase
MAEVHNGDDVKDQVEDLTSEEVVTKYRTAAEIANDAIKAVVAKAQAGAKIVELCQVGDKLITDRTGGIFNKTKGDKKISKGIAFPTCVSVNNTVGHFSPLANSEAELKAGDVVKM